METIKETKQIKYLRKSEIENIFLLTKPYYLDPSYVIERELKHNDTIYLLKDEVGNILSFFMVAWEKHRFKSIERDVVYLGLSCASQINQEKKFASRVYYNFTVDAYNYQQDHNTELILYCTTATPVVLLTVSKFWDNVKPDLEGNFNQNDRELVESITNSNGLCKFSCDHPFILKGIATNTTYSEIERVRLKEVEIKNNITIFKKLNIDETQGDRLLIICTIPHKSKLDIIKSKLVD